MTKMMNEEVDLLYIIDNLDITQNERIRIPVTQESEKATTLKSTGPPDEKAEYKGRLWNEFLNCLNDSDDDDDDIPEGTKRYTIDEDIVATLHQCYFGKPNAEVINAILRVFLTDNILHLKELVKPKVISLLDKIERP